MAHLGLAFGTLLFGLLLQALAKPKARSFIGLVSCVVSAFMTLMLVYFILKSGNPISDIFTSFNYISLRIRLNPLLASFVGIAAIISVLTATWFFIKNKTKSWIVPLGTFLVYFCLSIDSIVIAFITFIILCVSIRYAIFSK